MAASRKIDSKSGIVTTSDGTQTVLISYALPTGSVCSIDCDIVARKSDGDGARVKKTQTFRNVSGTLTAIGALTDIIALVTDVSLATIAITMAVNGAAVEIKVTGIAATTIDWLGLITVYIN